VSADNEYMIEEHGEKDNAVLKRMAEIAAAKNRAIDSLHMFDMPPL